MPDKDTEIKLGSYVVRWDGTHNWIVWKVVTRKPRDGGPSYQDEELKGYYGSDLAGALRSLLGWGLTGLGAQSAKQLTTAIAAARDEITKAVH